MEPRNFLFTIPRSASHLLIRILNLEEQSNILCGGRDGGYFFFNAQMKIFDEMKLSNDVRTWTKEEMESVRETLQAAAEAMIQHIDTAEHQGYSTYIKEHALWITDPVLISQFTFKGSRTHGPRFPAIDSEMFGSEGEASHFNASLFSDAFLKTLRATFLIRHPALMIPSLLRAMKDFGEDMTSITDCTLHWSRQLYDWFVQNKSVHHVPCPIILDADDIISQPEYLTQYSTLVGLDPSKLRFSWMEKTEEELALRTPEHRRMTDTLNASSGIIKEKGIAGESLQIAEEVKKWELEFGAELASIIEDAVRASMDDYEYMRARRLKPQQEVTP